MEIELKLLVNSQGAQALREHPLLSKYATAKSHEQRMSDTYFDTQDLQIRRVDAGLRVRQMNNGWVQTLKGGGGTNGGLHCRHEWESQVTGPAPNLAGLRDIVRKTAWARLLRSLKDEEKLVPIFTTRVRRRVWTLRLPQGDEVECVLDLGNIECKNQKVPISEVELELKSGNPTHLVDLALALLQDIPMRIGNLSKADRGYALYAMQPPSPVKAAHLALLKRMTIEQAFQAIAGNCMMQIQANAACVAQDVDRESLHQMRVGLRRLRSALGLFENMLQLPEDLIHELDWLSIQLGAARDWDVLASSTLPLVAEATPDETRLAEVKLAALGKAHEKHKTAAAAVSSTRFTRLILCFTRWVLGRGWQGDMLPQGRTRLMGRVTKFSRKMLVHEQRLLLKRGRQLQAASPKGRHRIRIAVKNTRYATEFFQSLYSFKRVRPSVGALSTLQNELGRLNDAAVAGRLLEELQNEQVHLERGTCFIRRYLALHIENDDKKLRKLWKKFASIKRRC